MNEHGIGDASTVYVDEREILLAEYEAAQSSAQHHDTVLWSATSIIWSGNLVLLGLALSALHEARLIPLLVAIAVLGVVLVWVVHAFARDFRKIKNQKYDRCKAIERRLGYMSQHKDVQTPVGRQAGVYWAVSVLFTLTWMVVIGTAIWLA